MSSHNVRFALRVQFGSPSFVIGWQAYESAEDKIQIVGTPPCSPSTRALLISRQKFVV